MAYPPSVPTTGRTNTTPQVNTHPADHNAIHSALTDIVNELGTNPKGDAADVGARFDLTCPLGVVLPYAGASAPTGWALCDGTAVSRSTYSALFALIGTTFGAGDGSTTFNLPDLRSRFIAGKGTGTWSDALAETGGSKDAITVEHTHTATTNTTGSHTHSETTRSSTAGASSGSAVNANIGLVPGSTGSNGSHSHTVTVDNAGSSGTDANLPPYLTLNHIIRVT